MAAFPTSTPLLWRDTGFTLLPCLCSQYRTSSEYIVKPKPTVSQAQSESTSRRVLIYGIQDDNGTDIQNFALDLTPPPDVQIRTWEGTSDGMNVLGIVIFSATMGKNLEAPGKPFMSSCKADSVFLQVLCWGGWGQTAAPW